MKFFHAGSETKALHALGLRRPLLSFASARSDAHLLAFWQQQVDAEVFMDSGAFSVASRGARVNLDEYIAFCYTHRHWLSTYVQLDVLEDPVQTRTNLDEMERAGLRPMPVYTATADERELSRLCERYDYIGLGGLRNREMHRTSWRIDRLDRVFRVARKYWPVKFHLFGTVAQGALERYPVYSADSASVTVGGAYGIMLRERHGRTAWVHWSTRLCESADASVSDLPGTASESARTARWERSLTAFTWLEQYVTDLWGANGIVFADAHQDHE